MGGANKALVEHGGHPLYQYAVENLSDVSCEILINTHRDTHHFVSAGFQVIGDGEFEDHGPLAGIHAGMVNAATPFVAFAACDQLLLPDDIYAALFDAATAELGAYARSDTDDVPTCAVLPAGLAPRVRERLESKTLALMKFMRAHAVPVTFTDTEFGNLNFRHQVS